MTSRRATLLAMAAACVIALALALLAQYRYDMQPCPWCILQRLIDVLIAGVCLIGAALPGRGPQRGAGVLALLLAIAGAVSAVYQHVVAANTESCALTFADRFLTRLALDKVAPSLFEVRGSCADAAVSVFGVPFDVWSLALYGLLGIAAVAVLRR